MTTVILKRRLVAKEDLLLDADGENKASKAVFSDGTLKVLTPLNAAHLPVSGPSRQSLGGDTVESVLLNLNRKLGENGDAPGGEIKISILTSDTASIINEKLKTIPQDLNGKTVTVSFPESGLISLTESIIFQKSFNGKIEIYGNNTTLNVSSISDSLLVFQGDCSFSMTALKFTSTVQSSESLVRIQDSACTVLKCFFDGGIDQRTRSGLILDNVRAEVIECDFRYLKNASEVSRNSSVIFNKNLGVQCAVRFLISCSTVYPIDDKIGGIDSQLVGAVEEVIPIGFIMANSANDTPVNWLQCNGQRLSRTSYPKLYDKIKGIYGPYTDSEFAIPDLRAMFIRGWDNGRGKDKGRLLGNIQKSQSNLPEHTHLGRLPFYKIGTVGKGTGQNAMIYDPNNGTSSVITIDKVVTTTEETRPENISLVYMIKAK